MKKVVGLALLSVALTACQTSTSYNGVTGYKVESQSEQSALIQYTLAQRTNQAVNESRLQQVCQQVLGKQQKYHIQILNQQEISAPKIQNDDFGVRIGESRMKVAFSHSPELHNSEGYAGRQVSETRPNTLTVVRYQCQK